MDFVWTVKNRKIKIYLWVSNLKDESKPFLMSKDTKISKEKQKEGYKVIKWSGCDKFLKERGKLAFGYPTTNQNYGLFLVGDIFVGEQKYSNTATEKFATLTDRPSNG